MGVQYRLWILITLPVAIAAGALKACGWPATGCGQLAIHHHGPLPSGELTSPQRVLRGSLCQHDCSTAGQWEMKGDQDGWVAVVMSCERDSPRMSSAELSSLAQPISGPAKSAWALQYRPHPPLFSSPAIFATVWTVHEGAGSSLGITSCYIREHVKISRPTPVVNRPPNWQKWFGWVSYQGDMHNARIFSGVYRRRDQSVWCSFYFPIPGITKISHSGFRRNGHRCVAAG